MCIATLPAHVRTSGLLECFLHSWRERLYIFSPFLLTSPTLYMWFLLRNHSASRRPIWEQDVPPESGRTENRNLWKCQLVKLSSVRAVPHQRFFLWGTSNFMEAYTFCTVKRILAGARWVAQQLRTVLHGSLWWVAARSIYFHRVITEVTWN